MKSRLRLRRSHALLSILVILGISAWVCRSYMSPGEHFHFLVDAPRIDAFMYEQNGDAHFISTAEVYASRQTSAASRSIAARELANRGFVNYDGIGEVWSKEPSLTVYLQRGYWNSTKLECVPDSSAPTLIVAIENRHQVTLPWQALRNLSDILRICSSKRVQ